MNMNVDTKDFDTSNTNKEVSNIDEEKEKNDFLFNFIDSEVYNIKNNQKENDLFDDFSNLNSFIDHQIPVYSHKETTFNNYFSNTQNWIGYITNVFESDFEAKLIDRNKQDTYEMATFEKLEISEEDKKFIEIGAVFYWSVGYAVRNGQVKKESLIRFKRTVDWTENEYDKAVDRANNLLNNLSWE